MKLEDVRDTYYYHSQKTSDIVRQLGFAGIALIWMFKTDLGGGKQVVPPELIPAARFIVIGLALDLLHYVAGTLIWAIYNRRKERAGTKEGTEFLAPPSINWPTLIFFWAKTIIMIYAYVLLIRFLLNHIL
ncbi:MAG: hypothetical protein WBP93_15635 [Pyrinomonadaceae bacterium]